MNFFKCLATLLLFIAGELNATTLQGKVVSVADGDTINVLDEKNTQHKIRLLGIDAPEKSQEYGQRSKHSLHQLIYSKLVRVVFQKKDKYGRIVGKVTHGAEDVCLEQIKLGMAWHYKQYVSEQSKEDQELYAHSERRARNHPIGLWKEKQSIEPWEYRKQHK